jgi:hypothetical protein
VSGRAALSYEQFAEFSFPIKQVWSLIIPFIFGGATMRPYRVPYWGDSGIFVTCGYVGLLSWLLAIAAMLVGRKEKLVWFWAGLGGLALILALGEHLPLQLNRLLFHLPIYNLFRASFRHLYEFTFALAVLAGLGLNGLLQHQQYVRLSVWRRSWVILGSALVTAVIVCIGLGSSLARNGKLPEQARSVATPELLVPVGFFLLSGLALWRYARQPNWPAKAFLLTILFLDVAAYGHALDWRAYPYQMYAGLTDPPAVQFIKQRELDWNAFRILSYTAQPFGSSYSALNYPNLSIVRGLQSVNGYDMLRLTRPAEVLGQMTPEGVVTELNAFDLPHQGFNLFNVKYLLCERISPPSAAQPLTNTDDLLLAGVRFPAAPLDLHLRQGQQRVLLAGAALADEVALVTTLANAGNLRDQTPVAKLRLSMRDGRVEELRLLAGRDTAEWAYDRADVRAVVQHGRALAVESWPEEGFAGQRYLARLRFARGAVTSVKIEAADKAAQCVLYRAVVRDTKTNQTFALLPERWPSQRWKKLAEFGEVEVYENLAWLPRAWLVEEAVSLPRAEVLQTIIQGEFANQQPFQPVQVALLEVEDQGNASLLKGTTPARTIVSASVQTLRHESADTEYAINSQQPGWLIMSEVHYPGWEATLDGAPAALLRVNYALRGVRVPAGEHRVRLRFQPVSVRHGASLSAFGLLLLLASFIPIRYVQRRRN